MALSKEAYQALEDIVGPENISDKPVVLDSYAFALDQSVHSPDMSCFGAQAEAVLLPGSTAEVQAIVKACNRYRIKTRPFSTGWTGTIPSSEGVIDLDLRRMNRILEIDERNMFAVIEPFVINAQLQAEAMKVGLNAHIHGAGANCSPLAAATSGSGGAGPDTFYMGQSGETLLAFEWVMPNGEILRSGSMNDKRGWFCGEGPGPSLRGIIRGYAGALGAFGIFTKCAVKLYPWPGPAVLPVEGTIPAYNTPLPENFRAYTVVLSSSWKGLADAYYKFYDNEIGYVVDRQFNMLGDELGPAFWTMYATDPTKSLDHLEEYFNKPEIKKLTEELRHYNLQVVLVGMTPADLEYQDKVLDQILADTGGHKVAAWSTPEMERFTLLYLLTMHCKHLNNVYAGGRSSFWTLEGTPDFVTNRAVPMAIELMRKHQEKGGLVNSGSDNLMGKLARTQGGGRLSFEQFIHHNSASVESIKATQDFVAESARLVEQKAAIKARKKITIDALRGAPQPARYYWQWRIKQMLDPNGTGDSGGYLTLEPPEK